MSYKYSEKNKILHKLARQERRAHNKSLREDAIFEQEEQVLEKAQNPQLPLSEMIFKEFTKGMKSSCHSNWFRSDEEKYFFYEMENYPFPNGVFPLSENIDLIWIDDVYNYDNILMIRKTTPSCIYFYKPKRVHLLLGEHKLYEVKSEAYSKISFHSTLEDYFVDFHFLKNIRKIGNWRFSADFKYDEELSLDLRKLTYNEKLLKYFKDCPFVVT